MAGFLLNMTRLSLILPFIILFSITDRVNTDSIEVVPLPVDSVTSQAVAQPEIEVTIGLIELSLGTDSAVVDILCDTKGLAVGGFDLRVATRSKVIDIVAIEPGKMQVDNHWSMFSASETLRNDPENVWHIVSLARSMSANDSLAVLFWPGEVSIARLVLSIREPQMYFDTLHSIHFYWSKCADNSLSDSTGSNLMVGRLGEAPIILPTMAGEGVDKVLLGPALDCFTKSPRSPAQIIRFNNGGIVIRSEIEPAPVQDTAEIDTIPPAQIEWSD